MMTDGTAKRDYENAMDLLNTDPDKGVDQLTGMVKNSPVSRQIYFKSITLKSLYNIADSREKKEEVIGKIKELAAEFLEAQSRPAESHSVEESEAFIEKKNYFLARGTPRKIIFRGTNLSKSYPESEFRLHNVDLSLRLGEITGLVGGNANGKTTLLKIIAGKLKEDTGEINYFFGERPELNNDWEFINSNIAYLPQELPKIPGTMIQSLRVAASMHGITGEQNEIEVNYLIERLGLYDHRNKPWTKLSGGYKLRFSLARILIRKPRFIIMDEPLANLDIATMNHLLYDLRELANSINNPISIIFSSQHIEEVEAVSDKILLLSLGNVIYYGPGSEIGNLRKENAYEIETRLSRESLVEQLKDLPYINFYNPGLSYVITTGLDISMDIVLKYFGEHGIPVRSLRDISNSSRKFLLHLTTESE